MRFGPLILVVATFSAGCTTLSLDRNSLSQSESLSDLRYKEVLYNLAALAENPAVLPAYASIAAGTTTISDTGTITPTTVIGRELLKRGTITHFQSETLELMAQRRVEENWSLDPVAGPERLQAMRYACWWVLFGKESVSETGNVHLGNKPQKPEKDPKDSKPSDAPAPGYYFAVTDQLAGLPDGWLHRGGLKDVPVKAAYKAHCGHSWVWVWADGMEGLTKFTIVMHKISRTATDSAFYPDPEVRTIVKQGSFGNGANARTVKVTAYVDMNDKLVSGAGAYVAGFPFKKRIDDVGVNPFERSIITAAGSKTP
jgi:hypothetical protein